MQINEELNREENNNQEKIDYDFLHEDIDKNKEIITSQFDKAFNEANPVVKDYILSDDFEKNIKTICKIEKLEEEKSVVIIENIAVSILVGLIPIENAKDTIIESFKSSNINIEPFAAGLVLKNIDAYILSDVRKKILASQNETKESLQIRHLTLKDANEEKEKEELRKILLERTGNLTGKGEVMIKYKDREIPSPENIKNEENKEKEILNRDSLLAKINISNVSDSEKIKERMLQIKKEEEERIKKLENLEHEKQVIREKREELQKERDRLMEEFEKENTEVKEEEKAQDEKNENISRLFAQNLAENINKEENENIEKVLNINKNKTSEDGEDKQDISEIKKDDIETEYSKNIKSEEKTFDPYRESL